MVVLRMGKDGALVSDPISRLHVRPPHAPVVDVTGAGNAFCGGFLAGWISGGSIEHASRMAAAAAAKTIAQYGPPDPRDRDGALRLATMATIKFLAK